MAGCEDYVIKYDHAHASNHFHKKTYEHALTQKGHVAGATFQTYTDVDRNGNVGKSGIGNFNTPKKRK